MKTNRIAITLLAAAALMLSACDREKDIDITSFGEDEVAFKIGSVQTRSAAQDEQTTTLQIGSFTTESGDRFILEDEVTSLDGIGNAPETRGTPAFTENVKALYGTFKTVAYKESGDAFSKQDVEYTNEKDNIWHYRYGENIWANLPTWFFMRMPVDMESNGVNNLSYDKDNLSISFSYTSPAEAANQQDILFSSYKRTEKTNAEEVIFFHALTGVKFANYFNNPELQTKTIIKSVTISGLKNSGNCKITPDFSKKSSDVTEWSNLEGSKEFTQTFSEDFAEYDKDLFPDGTLNLEASKQNLNDAKGSLTFFFIPQELTEDVKIAVEFDVKVGDNTHSDRIEVSLYDALAADHRTWKAGELHTFTLKPNYVDIDITDEVEGTVKSDVVITNKGNVDEYIRATIVAYWADADGNVVSGYKDEAGEQEFDPWTLNTSGSAANYGTFEGFIGSGWTYSNGYYYYTTAVGPLNNTATLFTKYTCDNETVYVLKYLNKDGTVNKLEPVEAHLVMDIAVQAIEKGSYTTYSEAWENAK